MTALSPQQLRALKGETGFRAYYKHMFQSSSEEFEQFIASLTDETYPILRTRSKSTSKLERAWKSRNFPWSTLPWNHTGVQWPTGVDKGTPLPGVDKHLLYAMNASSLLPVMALNAQPGETVLDACAAPGGKALYIADGMKTGTIMANDTSPKRRARLQQALLDFGHSDVQVLGTKAETLFKRYPDTFDRILVDAPCSSEKHVFTSPTHLNAWTYNRIKSLAQRQVAILSGLFLALKPGGRMVYSTCAVNTQENEAVVARLLKKKKAAISLLPFEQAIDSDYSIGTVPGQAGMPGEYVKDFNLEAVRRVIPHRENHPNLDPMFVAVFEKEEEL